MSPLGLQVDLPGNWVEAIITLVVLAGWVVRSLTGRKEEQKKSGAGKAAAPPTSRETREGLERWRELLEGRAEMEAPPELEERAAPPPPPLHRPQVAVEGEARGAERADRFAPRPTFVVAPSEEELAKRVDESVAVESMAAARVAAVASSTDTTASDRRAARRLRAWRAAVVGAEILERPLALRAPGELPGALSP